MKNIALGTPTPPPLPQEPQLLHAGPPRAHIQRISSFFLQHRTAQAPLGVHAPPISGTGAITISAASLAGARAASNAPTTGQAGDIARTAKHIQHQATHPPLPTAERHRALLQELHDLRTAVATTPELSANQELSALLSSAAQVLLFTPLTQAAKESGNKELVDLLAEYCVQLVAADSRDSLREAGDNLDATLKRMNNLSTLPQDSRQKLTDTLMLLATLKEAKAGALDALQTSADGVAELEEGFARHPELRITLDERELPPAPGTPLSDVYAQVLRLRDNEHTLDGVVAPFTDLFLAALAPQAEEQLARLNALSTELREALGIEARRLVEDALHIDFDVPGPAGIVDADSASQRLMGLLEIVDSYLHPADMSLLSTQLSSTLRALEAGELAAEVFTLLRPSTESFAQQQQNVASFRERVATALADPACSDEAAATLSNALEALDQHLTAQSQREHVHAGHTLQTATDLLTRCQTALQEGRIAEAGLAARQALDFLEDMRVRAAIMTDQAQAEELAAVESHAQLVALSVTIQERASLRVTSGTLQDVQQQIENAATLTQADRKALQTLLAATSAAQLKKQEQELQQAQELLAGKGQTSSKGSVLSSTGLHFIQRSEDSSLIAAPETQLRLFKTSLDSLRTRAGRTLLAQDAAAFNAQMDAAMLGAADRLTALVYGNADLPRLSKALQGLSGEQSAAFRLLTLKSWANPIFLRALEKDLETHGTDSLGTLLQTLGQAWGDAAPAKTRVRAVALLEALALPLPELDALSLDLEKSCLPEEEHALLTQKHGSERGKRELGKIFAKARGTDKPVSDKFLQIAVRALQGHEAEEFDLLLLKVYWNTLLSAEGVSDGGSPERFTAFQQSLPQPYKDMDTDLLSALVHSGMQGLSNAHAVASVLASASRTLSGSSRVTEIFQQICHHADRYRAEQISTILVRNLLEAQSITGAQALETGGALREAINRDLRKEPSLKNRIVDKLRILFTKNPVMTESFDDQLFMVLGRIPDIREHVHELLAHTAVLGVAEEVLAGYMEEHAKNLAYVQQKGGIIPGDAPGATPLVNPEKLKGEQLSVGLLALFDILRNPDNVYGQNWQEQKQSLAQLDFQKILRVDEMRGLNWGEGPDEYGGRLKMAVEGLRNAKNSMEFEANRRAALKLFEAQALLPKSEAILFFKSQHEASGVNVLQRALTKKHKLDPRGVCVQRMQKKYATLRGSGARAAQAAALSGTARAEDAKLTGKLIDAPMRSLSTHVAQIVNTAVHLAILETFQKSSCETFEEFLGQIAPDRTDRASVMRSPHFSDSLRTLEKKLGISGDLAEFGLLSFIKNAQSNVLQTLAGDTSYGFAVALRNFITSREVNGEVKTVMAEDKARNAAQALVQRLGNNQSIALHLDTGVALSVSTATMGQLDLRATLGVAKEHGLCAWRDSEGKPHLTVSKGFSGIMGVSVEGILGTIAAKANISASKLMAGELSFPSDAAFVSFMGELFSGQADMETLRHCEGMAYSSSISASGQALFTTVDMTDFFGITAGVAEFNFEAKAGLSKTWTEKKQGETRTVSDTMRYNLGINAQLGMLGKDYIQMVADPVIDVLAQQTQMPVKTREKAHRMLGQTGIEARYSLAITKNSTKIFTAGKLSGAETTRTASLTTADPHSEAEILLTNFDVPSVLQKEVLQGVTELHKDKAQCSLEVAWKLSDAGLNAWRAATSRTEQERILGSPSLYDVNTVTVHGTWSAVENNTWLGGMGQAFSRNANGTHGRDIVYSLR